MKRIQNCHSMAETCADGPEQKYAIGAILRSGALDGDMCIFSCVSSVYLRFFGVYL